MMKMLQERTTNLGPFSVCSVPSAGGSDPVLGGEGTIGALEMEGFLMMATESEQLLRTEISHPGTKPWSFVSLGRGSGFPGGSTGVGGLKRP